MQNGPTPLPQSQTERSGLDGRLIDCLISELLPHPSYARHKLSVQTSQLAALAELGELAFKYPLIVTRDRFIVDGYARFELGKRHGRAALPCVEYDLDEQQALEWLIETHRPSHGLSDFMRVELALDLETQFRNKAMVNRQEGGRMKGLSTLTEAERVNSRREIARVARVSVGNVHKVKYILARACGPLTEATRAGEISINRAEKWSHEPESKQRESLRLLAIERGIRRKARQLVAAEAVSVSKPNQHEVTLSDLFACVHRLRDIAPEQFNQIGSIAVGSVAGPGRAIFVTQDLMETLKPHQKALIR